MKTQEETKTILPDGKMRRAAWTTVLCDVILLAAFVVCLLIYTSGNNVKSYEQNVENLSNLARANSGLLQAALDKSSYEIRRAYNYCAGKSVPEILDYLSLIGASGEEYQLLRREEALSTELYHVYAGYSTKKEDGTYCALFYENSSLAKSLHYYAAQEDGAVSYSQSFTNQTDAQRYFAIFCGMPVEEDGQRVHYYLVKPQKESSVLDQAQRYSQYKDLAIAICYTDGKYLAQDTGFRGDNFYDYLYKYNGLSLDEKNALRDAVQGNAAGSGVLTYQDYQKRACVFAYAACGKAENWLVIVSVPAAEFSAEKLFSTFPLMIIFFMTVLLVFNIYRLLAIVRELRRSVARERIASAAKSSFLSRMSHEIRTPLNAVIGYNTIARNELADARDEADRRQAEMKVLDCLTKSGVASKHLLTVINDVLDMSAIESGRIQIACERFDFKGLITSLTTVFYSQARAKGVRFEVLFDTLTAEWFVGDQMRTNQILTNLLSNAIKFTPEGGTVTLNIRQPEADTNASHIHFDITDTGIGMTQEYLGHIWTPFEQADSSISRRFGGTGLGLSITKTLVDMMGGAITVDSVLGQGTSFHVDLTFAPAAQPERHNSYDFSSVNALVVDDDSSTCDYIRLLFQRCGARCVTVTTGEDALQAITLAGTRGERYSLCLVDWRMPQMDGIETVRRIRALVGDELPIIVLTAYDYSELADQAAAVGVTRFLSKPLFQSSLFDLLATVSGVQVTAPVERGLAGAFSGERVLLTEDNAMNMEIAKTILETAGLQVDCAWNGREALESFTASPAGTYMAILMDIHMPEMNGHEATRAIRASSHPQARTVPIIAMTADAFAENVAEAYAAGMTGHIAKPIDIPTLFEALQRCR